MLSETEQSTGGSPSLDIVLSTWFFMYLREDRPCGLPNDFLTHASPLLLVVDKVICDQDALDYEERWRGRWLSADLIGGLKDAEILKPINMREYIPQESFNHIRNHGPAHAALSTMESELAATNNSERNPRNLKFPPVLNEINHYMFQHLNVPNTWRYYWREHHFKTSPSVITQPQRTTLEGSEGKEPTRDVQQIISVVKTLLPEFVLLPPISKGSRAAAALQQVIAKEKLPLYRWFYGDPEISGDRYFEIRKGGDYAKLDKVIDNKQRQKIGWDNLRTLLKIRDATKDVRSGVQKIIFDVSAGWRTIEDVQDELDLHMQELLHYLPDRRSISADARQAKTSVLVSLFENLVTLAAQSSLPIPAGLAMAARDWLKKKTEEKEHSELRQRYPLAFFILDSESIQDAEIGKAKPHEGRK